MILDNFGKNHPHYTSLVEAMVQQCSHPKASEIAAGFGHNKVDELMEFLDNHQSLNNDADIYDIVAGAAEFDEWCEVNA